MASSRFIPGAFLISLAAHVAPLAARAFALNRAEIHQRIAEARAKDRLAGDRISPLARGEDFGGFVRQPLEARLQPGPLAFTRVGGDVRAEIYRCAGREQAARLDGEIHVDQAALVVTPLPPRVRELHEQAGEGARRKQSREGRTSWRPSICGSA